MDPAAEVTALRVHSPGLTAQGDFRIEHTGRGADRSPELVLEGLSPEAVRLAVILEDLDHPIRGFPHWLVWNLPAAPRIPAGLPAGGRLPEQGDACQGLAYGLRRYAGPKPPRGARHRYRFTVYALDCPLTLGPWATRRALLRAMGGHILQTGELTGAFPPVPQGG